GRRVSGSDRHGDEARDESSHGATRTRGFHRPRHVRGNPRRTPRRTRRSEVSPVSAVEEVCRRRLVRKKKRARFLPLRVKQVTPGILAATRPNNALELLCTGRTAAANGLAA